MADKFQRDDILFSILRDCKTLPVFFDTIFGFLKRRTDFYHVATEEQSAIGLPDGAAESIVKQKFYEWRADVEIPRIKKINNKDVPTSFIDGVVEDITSNLNKSNADMKEFTSSESYNGAINENYTWSQTITDVDIIIKLPENCTAKDLYVEILQSSINVKHKSTNNIILAGDFCHKCKHKDTIWSIDNNKLVIHIDKLKESWWDCLLTSETKLDISKIDCSRPFEELSDEAQAKIEELTWNQDRKRLGLPTSEQVAMETQLKKAWHAKGSPFVGPFDPASVIMN